jgi:hypothetical protein
LKRQGPSQWSLTLILIVRERIAYIRSLMEMERSQFVKNVYLPLIPLREGGK